MKRSVRASLCLLAAICLLAGCTQYPVGSTAEYGDLLLTVPGDFADLSAESYAADADFLYGWGTLIVMGLAEPKSTLQEMTLEQYTAYVISGNDLSCTPRASGAGYVFSYEKNIGETPYHYTVATYAGTDNFWILQFYCPKENLAENQPEIDIILAGIQLKKG